MFAQTIFGTPDEWGSDTWYYDQTELAKTIVALKENDPTGKYQSDKCSEWELVQAHGDLAIYEEQGSRSANFVMFRRDADYNYEVAKKNGKYPQYNSLREAAEAAEDFEWVQA